MRFILRFAILLSVAWQSQVLAASFTLNYLGQQIVPTGQQFQGTTIGGLSGLDYDAPSQSYVAISDDRSQLNPARYYTLALDLSQFNRNPAPGQTGVSFLATTTINDVGGSPFAATTVDPEAIRMRGGSLYWTSEGERLAGNLQNPFVREMSPAGGFLRQLSTPAYYNPVGVGAADPGIRRNLAFESLTFSNDGATLYTATENALVQDGPPATTVDPSPSRILALNTASGAPLAEYIYPTEPVAVPPVPVGQFATNGLVELLNIPGVDSRLLAIERSFSTGVGNAIRLYEAELNGATNVGGANSIVGLGATPVSKSLLIDLGALTNNDHTPVLLDNVEGMTWGPTLPNGNRSLVLVSDNNFSATQFTQFLAFEVQAVPEPAAIVLFVLGALGFGACVQRR